MSRPYRCILAACLTVALSFTSTTVLPQSTVGAAHPGARSILDAHNCYPYGEWWRDRIDRALSTGTPLAIEQDLAWYTDRRTGRSWSVLSHDARATGSEPTMKQYFFERVRPIVDRALKEQDRTNW